MAAATPDQVLLQYGAVGVLALVLLVAGKILLDKLLKSFDQTRQQFSADLTYERARAERVEAALQKLYETTQGANVDALLKVARSLDDAVHLIDEAVALVNRERRRGGLD